MNESMAFVWTLLKTWPQRVKPKLVQREDVVYNNPLMVGYLCTMLQTVTSGPLWPDLSDTQGHDVYCAPFTSATVTALWVNIWTSMLREFVPFNVSWKVMKGNPGGIQRPAIYWFSHSPSTPHLCPVCPSLPSSCSPILYLCPDQVTPSLYLYPITNILYPRSVKFENIYIDYVSLLLIHVH